MVIETWLKTDRKKPIMVKALQGNLFSADNEGNLIGVEVTEDGSPVTLSGVVTGYVIRADGYTVTVTGTATGNKASITLPSTCYSAVGPISIVIKLGNTTIGACHGYVYRTTTDAIVDPGHVIPSISELLAQIESCRLATNAANSAASAANTAAGSATSAASSASSAAAKIDTLTVAAQTLAPGSSASAAVSEVDGHKHILFGLVKGDPGKDFHIARTFTSIAEMEAYTGTDVQVNDFVLIDTGSVEDVDTGKIYRRSENGWSYIGDLSGKQGIKGDTGNGIASTVLNQDYTLTINYTDGTSYTTSSIRGAQGQQGVKGDTGDTGAKGDKGDTGATGATPNMSIGTVQTLTPGSPATASITGTPEAPVLNLGIPKGDTGSADNVYGSTIPMSASDSTKVSEAIAGRVNANQGSANAGKALGIDSTGAVVPVPFSGEDFTGATSSTAGVHGYVPAPAAGGQNKYLKADGTWSDVPNPQVMTGATASAAGTSGLVPAPAIAEREKFLCGDGTWAMPEGGKLVSFELDTVTNTSGSYTHTTVLADATHDMKAVMIEVSNPDAFNDVIHILTADGSVTLTCDDVAGTSDVTISCLFVANPSPITSSEFDVLASRIGTLASLQTTAKSDIVSAINETVGKIAIQYDSTGFTTLDEIKTFLNNVNSSLSDTQWKEVRFDIAGTNIDPFGSWTSYSGRLTRYTSTTYICEVLNMGGNEVQICRNGDTWNIISLNSNFTIKNVTLTPSGNTLNGIVKAQGKLVAGYIISTGKSCAKATYTMIGTISTNPIDTMYFPAFSGSDGSYVGMARVNYNGTVEVYPFVATSNVALSFAYFTTD